MVKVLCLEATTGGLAVKWKYLKYQLHAAHCASHLANRNNFNRFCETLIEDDSNKWQLLYHYSYITLKLSLE